jgi:hypothetical protein
MFRKARNEGGRSRGPGKGPGRDLRALRKGTARLRRLLQMRRILALRRTLRQYVLRHCDARNPDQRTRCRVGLGLVEVTPPSRIVWTTDEGGEGGPVTTVTLKEKAKDTGVHA